MINTFDELRQHSITYCNKYPEDLNRADLTAPLPSESDLESLRRYDGLPPSYIKAAEEIALFGKEIGYFLLWPEAFGGNSLSESLLLANSDRNPYASVFRSHGAYQVASFEAEPIGIIGKSKPNEGVVIKLDIGNPRVEPTILATSFEKLLFIAGSLDQVQEESEGQDAVEAFVSNIVLEIDPEVAEPWRLIGEIVLGC